MKIAFFALLFFAILASVLGSGFVLGVPYIFIILGQSPDAPVHLLGLFQLLICGALLGAILIYIADIIWLCIAKFFLTKKEVLKILSLARTKFDIWLINQFFPHKD